jgi:hypothetical protein
LQVYNVVNLKLGASFFLGDVGKDWEYAGVAPIRAGAGNVASDLVLRNVNTGAFQVYNVANNQLVGSASLGQVGLDWQLGGFAAAGTSSQPAATVGSTAQLVQAMAGFGGSGAGISNTAPLGTEASQQPLLTTPQHA